MKPLPWSHSALEQFNNCPRQFFEIRVAKRFKDSPNEASIWGNRLHEIFEQYLKGEAELEPEYEAYREYLDAIKARPGLLMVEQQLAIGTDLRPCDWFADNVWCRGILDVAIIKGHTAWVLDHKTGKRKANSKQLKLFALLAFAHYAEVQTVHTAFAWLKDNLMDTAVFTRDQVGDLWRERMDELTQYAMAFKHDEFPEKKSGLCRGWCPVVDCEHWKPKK